MQNQIRKEETMRFKIRKPFLFIFEPWLHWQEFRQHTSEKADFYMRYLHIGRVTILWDAPKNGTPTRMAHIRSTEPTELRIPKEKP